MSINFKTAKREKIVVHDEPFGKGGEGGIYEIITPLPYRKQFCVKVFHQAERTQEREKKIDYMIKNPPSELNGERYMICWPKELVYDTKGNFVGFTIPLAFKESIQLYELCRPTLNKLPNKWHKFDVSISKGNAVRLRLKLCVNMAIAIHKIHQMNHYVFVDMKPQNMLVTDDGKISIIDLDSIQIANNKIVQYPAHAVTPEYIPPEGYKIKGLHPSKAYIPITWDWFSMAVMFYEILFGLPPFAATFKGKYQNCDTIPDRIEHGLFPHGSKKPYVRVLPKWHNNFNIIPKSLRDLFLQAFEQGYNNPNMRPNAERWGQVFNIEIFKIEGNKNRTRPQSGTPSNSNSGNTYKSLKSKNKLNQIFSNLKNNINAFIFSAKKHIKDKSLYLFDLITTIIFLPLELILKFIKFLLSFTGFVVTAIFKTIIGLVAVILTTIWVIVAMLPLRLVVYLMTVGSEVLWKDSLFDKPKKIIDWIKEGWNYKMWEKYFNTQLDKIFKNI